MNMTIPLAITLIGILGALAAQDKQAASQPCTGPYLGQKAPGITPEVFAAGIVSLGRHEHRLAVSPAGTEIYFSAMTDDSRLQIMVTRSQDKTWTTPAVASFSDRGMNLHPAFAPGGKRLFFVSTRPDAGHGKPAHGADIWYVDRTGDTWSQPLNVGEAINTVDNESSPSVMADGTLFFDRIVKADKRETGIYFSRLVNEVYGKAEKLPVPVNSEYEDLGPFIAPDGHFLLFNSNRPGTHGAGDIYIAFRNKNGGWKEPLNLGETINSKQYDWAPMVTADGKYMFFSSYRNPEPLMANTDQGTLYWVDAKILAELKPAGAR